MKEPALEDWACRLLEDQLTRLGELRNANPRDAGFKLWRQTTLTVIQRVWPGNLQRSERFRRIPFTAPSAKPNRAQVREHFERGCGEAASYLQDLIREIQNGALDPNRPAVRPESQPASAARSSAVAASLSAPLPGEVPRVSHLSPPSPPAPSRPEIAPPPIPGFLSSSSSAAQGAEALPPAPVPPLAEPAPVTPPPAKPLSPAPPLAKLAAAASAPAAGEGGKRTASGRPPRPTRRGDRRALKEMLGFVDESPARAAARSLPIEQPYEPERPGAAFGEPTAPPLPTSLAPERAAASGEPAPSSPGLEPLFYDPHPLDAVPPMPLTEDPLPLLGEADLQPPPDSEPFDEAAEALEEAEDEPAMGADPAEMLRSSGWSSAREGSATSATTATPAITRRSPVAAALQALASEVAELGVPEGKRAAARAALTDLARQIDERSADWHTLRDAFSLAMDYPPLARRLVPLLVPFLDTE